MAKIVPALVGSLILVALIRQGSERTNSPAYIIGFRLADFMSDGFIAISALLGALGSFFSGSTTVSNLTFGLIQTVQHAPVALCVVPAPDLLRGCHCGCAITQGLAVQADW